jgi:hypothetical protein
MTPTKTPQHWSYTLIDRLLYLTLHDLYHECCNSSAFFAWIFIQNCFICRPSDSTVSEDAGIEPRIFCNFGIKKLCYIPEISKWLQKCHIFSEAEFLGEIQTKVLKVPKCEIFHLFDFNDFYGIKSL